MRLREPRFRCLVELMRRRIDPSFRALSTAGFHLAHSFLQLHSKGLCCHDISFGNLFLDPDTGESLICDNDNVTVDGETGAGVLGTPRFMAPEVVTGQGQPGIQTDLYSLAVLLFYLFVVHHPLEGARELAIHSFDLPAMNRLYDTMLFPHHIDEQRAYDFSAPVAVVRRHHVDPRRWGIENLSTESWVLEYETGLAPREIPPGRTAPLIHGGRIDFGPSHGEIRA
jgi:serine/threonine protein kinase